MRRITLLAVVLLALAASPAPSDPPEIDSGVLESAEALYREGSYALAREAYLELADGDLSPFHQRWVEFRLADTLWRNRAASEIADDTDWQTAREQLQGIIGAVTRVEDRDLVWAEAQESLGDSYWAAGRRYGRNWHAAWPHYQAALEWWAGSRDLDMARDRYLAIVWKTARPPHVEPHYVYGYYGNQIPLPILQNALKIAATEEDQAHAQYLIAMTLRHQGGTTATHRRTAKAFEAAIAVGPSTPWYDDALYHYAEWLESSGRWVRTEDGGFRSEPDFPAALAYYRRIVDEFEKGETRYHDQATSRIRTITTPSADVVVTNLFLPGSEIEYHLRWRNVDTVRLALYRVDLLEDPTLDQTYGPENWKGSIALKNRAPVRTWTYETNDPGNHAPGSATLHLAVPLPTGTYVIEATGGQYPERDFILVSDLVVLVKAGEDGTLVWAADAVTGEPRDGVSVKLWERPNNRNRTWIQSSGRTGADGTTWVGRNGGRRGGRQMFVAASRGDAQAFATGWRGSWHPPAGVWRVYAFTDRPAYRPGEEVRWKIVARVHDGKTYSNPDGVAVRYVIRGPRGDEAARGTVRLNAFGSAWGTLPLGPDLALGVYTIHVQSENGKTTHGVGQLFRLEEYKLPEFRVNVVTPEENGRPRAFVAGETVEAEIAAEYYFGGPVTGAEVEVLVYQRPYHVWWHPPREFPWFHEEDPGSRPRYWGGPGEIVLRETLRTDDEGKARIRFDTPPAPGHDLEYTVEARVVDASRREIIGRGTVRAGLQRYYAFVRAEHHLHRPRDTVRATVKTVDANRQPYPAEGRVTITRDEWKETDYRHEEILTRLVTTDENGEAEIAFEPDRSGTYRIAWLGGEEDDVPVRGETMVWVADPETVDVGYRHGGVGIILDRDTFRAGERTPVMLTSEFPGAWVLLTQESEVIHDRRVVRIDGTAKLVEIDVREEHVPNVFLEAALFRDTELFLDSKQVVVPPVAHFLKVEIEPSAEEHLPGAESEWTVTTRDHDGNPVSAEISLGVADESVLYIQTDFAGDPRQFFFGQRRGKRVQTFSSLHGKSYAREEEEKEEITTEHGSRFDDLDTAQLGLPGRSYQAAEVRRKAAAPVAMDEAVGFAEPAEQEAAAAATPEIEVRSDFRSTAFWQPDILTDENGRATVKVRFPDSTTTWKATARAVTTGNAFGIGAGTARTSMPMIVRLQAPRFFVVGDEVVVSAVINNNTDAPMTVRPDLAVTGLELAGRDGSGNVTVPANGEARVDWTVIAEEAGEATIRVTGSDGDVSDGMERTYTVWEHGVEKFLARSGKIRGDGVRVTLDLPAARRAGSESLAVQVTPSMAVTLLDALPYLIDYPYGCTEQTMSRFLPAAIVSRTLTGLGLDVSDVAGRLFGGIEPAHAGETHPDGPKDLRELDDMVAKGIDRLYRMQHGDGGWGWWKEGDSDPFMTAYVVWGFSVARDAGIRVDESRVGRAVGWLDRELVEAEETPDLQAWMLHALTAWRGERGSRFEQTAMGNLWERRDRLNAYTRALFALAAWQSGDVERARVLARNLVNGVVRDDRPDRSILVEGSGSGSDGVIGTAHWGEDRFWWRWSEGGVEATSFALRALLAIDPENELVEPVVNWLVRNRRGAQWSNTRDTAITVLTLTDYLKRSGELQADLEYEIRVNGRFFTRGAISPADVLSAPSRFEVDRSWLRDGDNEIRIVRTDGDGPLYFAAELTYFSLEEPVTPAGNEIFARRAYFRKRGYATLLKGYLYENETLADGGTVASGDRIEVTLTIEAKNDYEYLVFEDLKPAGFEAVELRSGGTLHARELKAGAEGRDPGEREPADYTGRSRWVYRELRDRKVALFLDRLPEGTWEIRYELRAETPGSFHALPVLGHAMYVPEIRCNGGEVRVRVEDR